VLAYVMTPTPPELTIGYRHQLRATARLALHEPMLWRRSLIGACTFAASTAFWATVAFLLAGPPYYYSASEIGLFGLLGVAGVITAKLIGRIADRGWQQRATGALLAAGLVSFSLMWAGGRHPAWLIAGIVLLDVAVRGTHLLNVSVVYGLVKQARSRIASIYMTAYTLGGILGAAAGAEAYRCGGWSAVSATGAAAMATGLGAWAWQALRKPARARN
jgi:predicted MFS family arabinose efflux permease